jgi:hypothetical protein
MEAYWIMKLLLRGLSLIIFSASAFSPSALGQRLVSTFPNGSITKDKSNERIAKVFGKYSVAGPAADIDLHKISYTSRDEGGKTVTLTGLFAWPQSGAPKGLVVFCHGTIQDRDASPSKWKGQWDGSEAESATLAFATGGYAVVIPDYLGLGDHKAAHPYPRNIINSQSAVDIIVPARQLSRDKRYKIGPKLYLTGYSEGGGIAMAATQKLEQMTGANYTLERSSPVSGPYDVSGATRRFMLQQPTDQTGFVVRLYLLSYAAYYLRQHSNVKITDYFEPAMANSIWLNYNRNPSDMNLIKALGLTSVLMRSKNDIRNVLTPRFVKAIETLDKRDPFVAALLDDNVYDWTPRTPMLLINLDGDGVVTPENTTNALNAMRRRGVTADTLRRSVIRDSSLNHVTAVPAAMSRVRAFFDGGFATVDGAR